MKKKVISVVLCASLGAVLFAGCGNSSDSSSASTSAETEDTEAAEEAGVAADEDTASADSASEEIAGEAEEEADTEVADQTEASEINIDDLDDVNFTVVTSYADNAQYGMTVNYFADYLEEHSEGKVTADTYCGGTFCTGPEELEYVNNGAIDISLTGAQYAVEYLPMASGSIIVSDGYQAVLDAGNDLFFNNEETATALANEAAAYNLKALATYSAFDVCIWSANEGGSWETLAANNTLGSAAYITTFQALGLNTQTVSTADTYESLSRGIVSAASLGLYMGYSSGMNEVSNYITTGHAAATAPQLYMNLEKYDSLSEATQQLLVEAARASAQYCVDVMLEEDQQVLDDCEAQGITVQELSDEDNLAYMEYAYKGNYEAYLPYAEANGTVDEFNALYEYDLSVIGSDMTLEDLQAGL
ncbi:MAG: TRAP transporter substrate-binding protein DctP [Lachnospiraceae bacterium]|nr:TRAP transporter substrate-binding protein DctP [Lachnospiraceae bacterium]